MQYSTEQRIQTHALKDTTTNACNAHTNTTEASVPPTYTNTTGASVPPYTYTRTLDTVGSVLLPTPEPGGGRPEGALS